ncbi:MAG: hypothetical protein GX765_00785 [Candidatus Moranbacteria bacterium]|nr:hypothetical protein [Candidatus Moranbacteria bacterium]
MKKHTRAKILFFGENCPDCDGHLVSIKEIPEGMKVIMRYHGREEEREIKRFGKHHAQSVLIARMVEDLI